MRKVSIFILGLAALLGASISVAAQTPPRDRFHGTISGSTGSYRGAHDSVLIRVNAPGSTSSRRHLTLVFSSGSCHGCLRLAGTLHGYLTPGPRKVPDVGASYTISAQGTLHGTGATTVSGTAHGTGFIANGYETMAIRLHGAGGTVSISARSDRVGAFTSP